MWLNARSLPATRHQRRVRRRRQVQCRRSAVLRQTRHKRLWFPRNRMGQQIAMRNTTAGEASTGPGGIAATAGPAGASRAGGSPANTRCALRRASPVSSMVVSAVPGGPTATSSCDRLELVACPNTMWSTLNLYPRGAHHSIQAGPQLSVQHGTIRRRPRLPARISQQIANRISRQTGGMGDAVYFISAALRYPRHIQNG